MADALNSRAKVTMAIAEAGGFFLMQLKDAFGNKALRVAAGNACPRAEDIARQVYIDIDHGRIEESLVEVFPIKGNIDKKVKKSSSTRQDPC